MSNELHNQIRGRMNLKETDELLAIWQANNRVEWSDGAFDVIKDILTSRGEEIPEQDEPVYEIEEDNELDEELEEWEVKALDNEDQPEFYNIVDVILLKKRIDKTAKAVIVVYILTNIVSFQWFSSLIWPIFQNRSEFTLLVYLITFIFIGLGTIVTIAITYFPLKALTHILRILMEMEFNSRKAN